MDKNMNALRQFLNSAHSPYHATAALEKELADAPQDAVTALRAADEKLKALLGWLLGGDNDVDKALGGLSLLAVCGDGRSVAANLLEALQKVIEQGAARLAESKAGSL